MWDRKHPAQVKQRYLEQAARKCAKDRLSGADPTCDPNMVFSECERLAQENYTVPECIEAGRVSRDSTPPDGPLPENPCHHLSLEELQRADAEASRDRPPR